MHYYQLLVIGIEDDILESSSYDEQPSDEEVDKILSEYEDSAYAQVYEQWGDEGKLICTYEYRDLI